MGSPATGAQRLGALLRATHPLPALAVTAFVAAYALTDARPARVVGWLAAAVLAGQLSVGWSNDAVDADLDRRAGRTDKPVALGQVGRRTVWLAAGLAVAACVALSVPLGPVAGALNLGFVVLAWWYNLAAKRTALSPLPYAVAFGLLPAVVTQAGSGGGLGGGLDGRWPPVPVTVATALLGVGAHFANTVPDVQADAATGVRGLPQRLGPRRSMTVMAVAVGVAALVLLPVTEPAGRVLLAGGAALAAVGHRSSRAVAFRITLAAVALVIAGVLWR